MARIAIDDSLCQGTAECVNIAPGLIELDGLGIATVVDPDSEVTDEVAGKLVATCPSQAISLPSCGLISTVRTEGRPKDRR